MDHNTFSSLSTQSNTHTSAVLFKKAFVFLALFCMLLSGVSALELLSVSDQPYHPLAPQRVIYYTEAASASLQVTLESGSQFSVPLEKAKDAFGTSVDCQGGLPCLVAELSITEEGTHLLSVDGHEKTMTISDNAYQNVDIFLEFFEATKQQNSAYHADYHKNYDLAFPYMADGSFILEADQVSTTLIRLGSAYNKNPALFATDNYDTVGEGYSDLAEHIYLHANYLLSLQGVAITPAEDGFRINPSTKVERAFVPGPTDITSLDIYTPGSNPDYIETVPVVSLCESDADCLAEAEVVYKCQEDELCLDISYVEEKGSITSAENLDFVKGWGYEFGCFNDINVAQESLTSYNPCHIFLTDTSKDQTAFALLALTKSLPAIYDIDQQEAANILTRLEQTAEYIDITYVFSQNERGVAVYGAALFDLYDYTGDVAYLQRAHELRALVDTHLISDHTRGPEFYWESYVAHKDDLLTNNLAYPVDSTNPEEFFRGKLYFDYKDSGPTALSRTGERVFQFDNNIRFQNSRFILTEGLMAAKTAGFYEDPEAFMLEIAHAQVAWLTGMNAVQKGVAIDSPIGSRSFIFGIGNSPTEYHSRLQVNTGYTGFTGGQVTGARGTGLQQFNGSDYVYLDGKFSILDSELGSMGNGLNGEASLDPFNPVTYNNGLDYIPGWINGAFDISEDPDVIFNYLDDHDTYEFTETTNEMVATAIELWAYLDAQHNDRLPHEPLDFSSIAVCGNAVVETGEQCDDGNLLDGDGCSSTCEIESEEPGVCALSVFDVEATCTGGLITADIAGGCRSLTCSGANGDLSVLACNKPGNNDAQYFEMYKQGQTGSGIELCLGETCIANGGFARSPDFPICSEGSDGNGGGDPDPQDPVCGNDIVEDGEQCDDGNNVAGDGCSAACMIEDQPPVGDVCYGSFDGIPITCEGGEIVSITGDETCKTIVCESGSQSLQVLACNKPNGYEPEYFEMYRQQANTNNLAICIANVCLQNTGFVRSPDYPLCVEGSTGDPEPQDPVCGNGIIEQGEACDAGDQNGLCPSSCSNSCTINECSNQASAILSIAPWFPQGLNVVFVCEVQGFTATSHAFNFGDGQTQVGSRADVWHTYPAAGSYSATCEATDGSTTAMGSLTVQLS